MACQALYGGLLGWTIHGFVSTFFGVLEEKVLFGKYIYDANIESGGRVNEESRLVGDIFIPY